MTRSQPAEVEAQRAATRMQDHLPNLWVRGQLNHRLASEHECVAELLCGDRGREPRMPLRVVASIATLPHVDIDDSNGCDDNEREHQRGEVDS